MLSQPPRLAEPDSSCSAACKLHRAGWEGRFGWGGVKPSCKHLHLPEPAWKPPRSLQWGLCLQLGGRGTGAGVCRGRGQRFPSGCHCERSAQAGAGRCERVIASSSAGRLHHPDGWREGSAPSRQPPGTRSRAGTRQGSASPAPANTATGGSWETSPVWVQRPAWLRQGCSRGHPSLGAARW